MMGPGDGRRAGAWRPSTSQAPLLEACVEPPGRPGGRLETWCRDHAGRPLEPDTRSLLPFVFRRLVDADGDAGIIAQAKAAYVEASWQNLSRIGRLLAVLRRFEEDDIPAVLLKGAALTLRYYRNYGMRSMADIDLLVHPHHVERAAARLADLGWSVTGGARSDFLPTAMRVMHACSFGAEPIHSLDLHWTLSVRSPEVDQMFWAATDTIEVDSTRVRVLSPTDQVFHVCTHAVQPTWEPSPRWILDVMAVLDAPGTRIDWARMIEVARRTNATVRLRTALDELRPYAADRIPDLVSDALRSATAPRWEQRELALFTRTPPFLPLDVLRWHWYLFRRLRSSDPSWCRQPKLVGFVDYVRLNLKLRGWG